MLPNIYGPYARPLEANGRLASPMRGNPSLVSQIETDFPGRKFQVQCIDSEVYVKFDDPVLTGPEETMLTTSIASWSPAVPASLRLWSYLDSVPSDHRQVDYCRGLNTRLHKVITNIYRGEVRQVSYYATAAATELVLQVDIVYTRAPNGLALSRTVTRTWYNTDGTPNPLTKVTTKNYDAFHQMTEGRKRRQNVLNTLTINVLNMLVATTAADPANPTFQEILDAEASGMAFIKSYQSDIGTYIQTGDLNWTGIPGVSNDNTPWLDNNVVAYGWTGPTIRDEILTALVEIYAP